MGKSEYRSKTGNGGYGWKNINIRGARGFWGRRTVPCKQHWGWLQDCLYSTSIPALRNSWCEEEPQWPVRSSEWVEGHWAIQNRWWSFREFASHATVANHSSKFTARVFNSILNAFHGITSLVLSMMLKCRYHDHPDLTQETEARKGWDTCSC